MRLLASMVVGCLLSAGCASEQVGVAESNATSAATESIPLYNPLAIEPLGYVNMMRGNLLPTSLDDTRRFEGSVDRAKLMTDLDDPNLAYLFMALAGMEYHPVKSKDVSSEAELDGTLARVVHFGDPNSTLDPRATPNTTGLEIVKHVKKPLLGFRADIVRTTARPHYIVAVRGTQVKQPAFIQTFANLMADLTAKGIDVDPSLVKELKLDSLADLGALRAKWGNRIKNDFDTGEPTVHAGILLSAVSLYRAILDGVVSEIDKKAEAAPPCVWLTGHSLGGGMAPLLAYLLSQDPAFNTRAKVCGVYTYGAPRVANREFISVYNRSSIFSGAGAAKRSTLDLGSVTLRYQLKDDPVPHVPPFIPHNDPTRVPYGEAGQVAELVAESLQEFGVAHLAELGIVNGLLEKYRLADLSRPKTVAEFNALGVSDDQAMLAQMAFSTGSDLLTRVVSKGQLKAKALVIGEVQNFRSVDHVGRTRWIDRLNASEYRIQTPSTTNWHHIQSLLSFTDGLRAAVCADRAASTHSNVKQFFSSSLGFHRAPFYASVLYMHTSAMRQDPRVQNPSMQFDYPDNGGTDDRVKPGLTLFELPALKARMERAYDPAKGSYMTCQ